MLTSHQGWGALSSRTRPHHAMVRAACFMLLISCIAGTEATAQEFLRITLGEGGVSAQRYSSRAATSVTALDGARVVLKQVNGKDYAIKAGHHGRSWFQVQQVPANASYIAVTPHTAGTKVALEITIAEKAGDHLTSLETTASGTIGEWIELASHRPAAAGSGGKRYSSSGKQRLLAIKVERLP